MASLGTRPTFGIGARVLEAYLLDFSGDLRGQRLELRWLEFQRGQQLFHSVDDLVEQMRADELAARAAMVSN